MFDVLLFLRKLYLGFHSVLVLIFNLRAEEKGMDFSMMIDCLVIDKATLNLVTKGHQISSPGHCPLLSKSEIGGGNFIPYSNRIL